MGSRAMVAADRDDDAVAVFAALGDPTRLTLVRRLGDGRSRPITELAEDLPQTRQAVTRHLTVLTRAGLVAGERVGREHRYHLRPEGLRLGRDYLDRAAAQWDDALGRLRDLVEDSPSTTTDHQTGGSGA
jgi:DNA-binding transcriptional ArsR family regulator